MSGLRQPADGRSRSGRAGTAASNRSLRRVSTRCRYPRRIAPEQLSPTPMSAERSTTDNPQTMTIMHTYPTLERLRSLRLSGMADAYAEQIDHKQIQSMTFDERLGLLVDREASDRESRRLTNRL